MLYYGLIDVDKLYRCKVKDGKKFYPAFDKFCRQALKGRVNFKSNAYIRFVKDDISRKGHSHSFRSDFTPKQFKAEQKRCIRLLYDIRHLGMRNPLRAVENGGLHGSHRIVICRCLGYKMIPFVCSRELFKKVFHRHVGCNVGINSDSLYLLGSVK